MKINVVGTAVAELNGSRGAGALRSRPRPRRWQGLADVAERAGMTSHALILQAISDRVEADEARNRLIEEADRRYAVIAETGQAVPWWEMRRYPERRVAHETTELPSARPLSE